MNISRDIHLWCQIPGTTKRVPYHKIPHIYLGNIVGFEESRIFCFFPGLYEVERQSNFLTENQMQRFIDTILRVMIQSGLYHAGFMQHIPGSFEDGKRRSLAASKEKGVRDHSSQSRIQLLYYYLPHEGLQRMWSLVEDHLNQPGFLDLANPILLLNGKNLKTMFRSTNPSNLLQQFQVKWDTCLDATELYANKTWLDIGKEIVNNTIHSQEQAGIQNSAYTFLWKKCCLKKVH